MDSQVLFGHPNIYKYLNLGPKCHPSMSSMNNIANPAPQTQLQLMHDSLFTLISRKSLT